ncbi:MAG: tetratricopeptide repeat protein [Acidobacteriota bacterium]
MSQKLTRKEMKKDEIGEALGRTFEFAEGHFKTIIGAVVGLLALVLVIVGLVRWNAVRGEKAGAALADAITVYAAPVDAENADPEDPDDPIFADDAARRTAAREKLQAVVDDYGSAAAADVARVYLGRLAADEGDTATARQMWQVFLDDRSGHLLAGEVRRNVIALDRAEGRTEEVVAELEAMLDQNPEARPLPGDVVLWELGRSYEELDRQDDATSTFQRLVEEYPESAFTAQARQKSAPALTLGA